MCWCRVHLHGCVRLRGQRLVLLCGQRRCPGLLSRGGLGHGHRRKRRSRGGALGSDGRLRGRYGHLLLGWLERRRRRGRHAGVLCLGHRRRWRGRQHGRQLLLLPGGGRRNRRCEPRGHRQRRTDGRSKRPADGVECGPDLCGRHWRRADRWRRR